MAEQLAEPFIASSRQSFGGGGFDGQKRGARVPSGRSRENLFRKIDPSRQPEAPHTAEPIGPGPLVKVSLLLRIGVSDVLLLRRHPPSRPVHARSPLAFQGRSMVGARGLAVRQFVVILTEMSTVAEIEAAVEKLSAPDLREFMAWIEERQALLQASDLLFQMYDKEERAS